MAAKIQQRTARPEVSRESRLVIGALVLLVLLQGYSKYVMNSDPPVAQVLRVIMYVGAAAGLYAAGSRSQALLRQSMVLVAFLILAVLSALWSNDPLTTSKDSLALVGDAILAYYLVTRFQPLKLLDMFAMPLAVQSVLSLAMVMLTPGRGRNDWGAGGWSGIYSDKNQLGAATALAIFTFLALTFQARGKRRWLLLGVLALCVLIECGAGSVTALVSCVATVVITTIVVLWRSKRYGTLVKAAAVVAVVSVGITALTFGLDWDALYETLGRNPTLSGRTEFWPYLMQAIGDRPFFGYGYDAFFLPGGPGRDYLAQFNAIAFTPSHAHNGFIQIALDVGLVGLGLFVVVLLKTVVRSVSLILREPSFLSAWPLMVVLFLLFADYSETYFARFNTYGWLFFVVAVLYLIRDPVPKTLLMARREFVMNVMEQRDAALPGVPGTYTASQTAAQPVDGATRS